MRILIAPDKMKGALSAEAAALLIANALWEVAPETECVTMPIADGGEGSAEILKRALHGEWFLSPSHDPLGRPIWARWLWIQSRKSAFIQMSEASGLAHLAPTERDPLRASTFGTGELIRAAMAQGADRICVGLGGSGTNDAGAGMAAAIGWEFLGPEPLQIAPHNFRSVNRLRRPMHPLPEFVAACDVSNPLLGPTGATHVFGPQKGASAHIIPELEGALEHLAEIVTAEVGIDHRGTPGAGAAGGTGFGLLAFCNASVISGFQFMADALGLEAALSECDAAITAEGSLDEQSLAGKGPCALAAMARRLGKPVFAFAGRIEKAPAVLSAFDRTWAISPEDLPHEEAMARAPELLTQSVLAAAHAIFSSAPPRSSPI